MRGEGDPRAVASRQLLIAGVEDRPGGFSQSYVGGVVSREIVAQFPDAAQ